MREKSLFSFLEKIYSTYNKVSYISPDPLEFLHKYKSEEDIELVGFIASSFALGRVEKILETIEKILTPLGENPTITLIHLNENELKEIYKDFKYRFFKRDDLIALLLSFIKVKKKYGSLENLFLKYYKVEGCLVETINQVVKELQSLAEYKFNLLLPQPKRGSACKRLFLFLRWMIRRDEVDFGIWRGFKSSRLIVPLDTHMLDISAKIFNLPKAKNNSLKRAKLITDLFSKLNREDPVKYDFSLTRFGINRFLNKNSLMEEFYEEV